MEERTMTQSQLREGMEVYGANGHDLIGTITRVHGNGFDVNGQHYTLNQVTETGDGHIHVRGTGAGERTGREGLVSGQEEDTLRVPVAEERLTVGKREVERGEATIRKTVTEEEQTVPVTLVNEEVRVEERPVEARRATAGEDLFKEETIRVPVRGEEAVVAKEAVVTGEVVVEKDAVTQERQVTDTVRKQHVDVDKAYQEARAGFEQAHTRNAATTGRTFEQAEPHYRSGFTAAHDERYAGQDFETAEPELRRTYESDTTRGRGGDSWEQLRREVREGWNRARNR